MPRRESAFEAIGTAWQIEADELSEETLAEVHRRIAVYDATYSRFRDDSLVAELAREGGSRVFPSDVVPLFELYEILDRVTEGAVNPCVGFALESLGYGPDYSLKRAPALVHVPALRDAVRRVGRTLTVTRPVLLDVGAAGKGQLVDLVAGILRTRGASDYVVDASGDLVHRGSEPIRVGLEDPRDPRRAIGVIELRDAALCASAVNRRRWGGGLHHVLDARTGEPTRGVIATWALAPSALLADGIATALFFADPADLAGELPFRFVRMFEDGRVEYSVDLPGEVFA